MTRRLPTSTSSRHQVRRRRHTAEGRAKRPSGGRTAARALEAARGWTAAHCSRSLPSGVTDRGEVPSTEFLPTKGSPHVAARAARRVENAWTGETRGRGHWREVDKQLYDTTHFAEFTPQREILERPHKTPFQIPGFVSVA